MKRAAVHNLGCKVNSYELDIIVQQLESDGYTIVGFDEPADVYIVNTCTVTNIADRKSRQMLHRAKKLNPGAAVVAVGCYVETDRRKEESDPAVDLAIGNDRKKDACAIIKEYLEHAGGPAKDTEPAAPAAFEDEDTAPALLTKPGHTRAFIKIQDGCNQFCSYCIIPYARGRIRSRDEDEIVEEVRGLAAIGVREVVLTGIHLSSYGKDKGEEPQEALLRLFTRIQLLSGIRRIRLGSLEPRLITEDFAKRSAGLSKLCPHFHLSLQSGCDATLKRMNRHYTADEYMRSVELLRRYFDRPAITTDVIVGFPGETEEEFGQSKAFLEKVGFYEIHVFKYSVRKGTVAASMPNQVPEEIKSIRSDELLELTARQAAEYRTLFEGGREEVLVEEHRPEGAFGFPEACYTGHTMRYVECVIPESAGTGEPLPDRILQGTITGMAGDRLIFIPD